MFKNLTEKQYRKARKDAIRRGLHCPDILTIWNQDEQIASSNDVPWQFFDRLTKDVLNIAKYDHEKSKTLTKASNLIKSASKDLDYEKAYSVYLKVKKYVQDNYTLDPHQKLNSHWENRFWGRLDSGSTYIKNEGYLEDDEYDDE